MEETSVYEREGIRSVYCCLLASCSWFVRFLPSLPCVPRVTSILRPAIHLADPHSPHFLLSKIRPGPNLTTSPSLPPSLHPLTKKRRGKKTAQNQLTSTQTNLLRYQRTPLLHIPQTLQARQPQRDNDDYDTPSEEREPEDIAASAGGGELGEGWRHSLCLIVVS